MAGRFPDEEEDDDGADAGAPGSGGVGAQRLDKWLWYARIVKSRSLAQRLITEGKVRIDKVKTDKPAATVRPGMVISLAVFGRLRVLEVRAPGQRRGPAIEAQALYADLTPPEVRDPLEGGPAGFGPVRSAGSGRPTKRDRRVLDRLRDKD